MEAASGPDERANAFVQYIIHAALTPQAYPENTALRAVARTFPGAAVPAGAFTVWVRDAVRTSKQYRRYNRRQAPQSDEAAIEALLADEVRIVAALQGLLAKRGQSIVRPLVIAEGIQLPSIVDPLLMDRLVQLRRAAAVLQLLVDGQPRNDVLRLPSSDTLAALPTTFDVPHLSAFLTDHSIDVMMDYGTPDLSLLDAWTKEYPQEHAALAVSWTTLVSLAQELPSLISSQFKAGVRLLVPCESSNVVSVALTRRTVAALLVLQVLCVVPPQGGTAEGLLQHVQNLLQPDAATAPATAVASDTVPVRRHHFAQPNALRLFGAEPGGYSSCNDAEASFLNTLLPVYFSDALPSRPAIDTLPQHKMAKLRAVMAYLVLLALACSSQVPVPHPWSDASQTVLLSRYTIADSMVPDWAASAATLRPEGAIVGAEGLSAVWPPPATSASDAGVTEAWAAAADVAELNKWLPPEGAAPEHALAVFSGTTPGGGVWSNGALQEETLFLAYPEALVLRIFCSQLGPEEASCIAHAKRWLRMRDTGTWLRFVGTYQPAADAAADPGPAVRTLVCMDASAYTTLEPPVPLLDAMRAWLAAHSDGVATIPPAALAFYPKPSADPFFEPSSQHTKKMIDRDLLKAVEAATSAQPIRVPFQTGNWGCGANGGQRDLKALQQLVVAMHCRRPIIHGIIGKPAEVEALGTVYRSVARSRLSVADLYRSMTEDHNVSETGNARGEQYYASKVIGSSNKRS